MILIVDSEKVADIKIKQAFESLGFKSVEVAKSAIQAREIIKSSEESKLNKINLIIIDSELDDVNGFELCRELKNTETGKHAYILMLVSSLKNKTAIEMARHNGATHFSVKPYLSDDFKQSFERFMCKKVALLVEDDPVVRQMVKAVMLKGHLEVIEVDDGIRANNIINSMSPVRFVLMDIGLPNISGIQLIKNLRCLTLWKKTPVLMLTGSTDASDVKASLSAGANDYLVKPFKPSELFSRLSKYLPDEN